jgi:hypothetical protein
MAQMWASYESNRPIHYYDDMYILSWQPEHLKKQFNTWMVTSKIVVTDYEFEIEFAFLKNLSTLTIHTYSYDGFYFRKNTFKHLPLIQIQFLELNKIFKIDNDTFSNLTNIQTLLISMGSIYPQETIISTFQSLDTFQNNIRQRRLQF